MKNRHLALKTLAAASIVLFSVLPATASSHREALAVLNEPCADNTDTYAWVSDGAHDKLYLIMNFNPLHEPGQGNHGLRACDGYRYEFHIAKGASLEEKVKYRVDFTVTLPTEEAPSATDELGGGNELLWQLTGGTETMTVTRLTADGATLGLVPSVIGRDLSILPNNHGPQTDRLIYGLGAFAGYDSGDPTSREVGLYDQTFVDTYIHSLANGGRIIAGQFDDPYQLDEKGIFDLVNLNTDDLGGIPGARRAPGKDVFTGFNVFSIALEVPMTDIFPDGIPHNGTLDVSSTDSLIRVWSSVSRPRKMSIDASNVVTGVSGVAPYGQVGRNGLPLFNAGLVGAQRQTAYLRSSPKFDVSTFGNDILYPVLVRDAEALGIYAALGLSAETIATLKGPRLDIINAINLGRPIPIADGFTGDVITIDAAIDSQFPNGRRLGGGTEPNRNQVNVNTVLISLIVAGNPAAGLAKGVEVNDKNYLDRFPFLALAHQGLLQGHGGTNVPTVPDIPDPNQAPVGQ